MVDGAGEGALLTMVDGVPGNRGQPGLPGGVLVTRACRGWGRRSAVSSSGVDAHHATFRGPSRCPSALALA